MTRETEGELNENFRYLKERGTYPHKYEHVKEYGCKICGQNLTAFAHNPELVTLYIQQALGDQ